MIEQQFGERIVELRHELKAATLAPDIAAKLNTKPGGPALVVIAQYFNDRRNMVQASISTHPADRFSYVGTFRRDWTDDRKVSDLRKFKPRKSYERTR